MNIRAPLTQITVAGSKKRFKVEFNHNDREASPAWSFVPDKVWDNPDIIVERKEDGHRFKLHIFDDENRLDSRRESVVDGLFVEKTDNAPGIRDALMPDLSGTILDGELVAGRDSNDVAHALGSHATAEERQALKYIVFDILFYKGTDVRDKPDNVRRAMLDIMFEESSIATHERFELISRPDLSPDEKKDVLMKALHSGEEGVMLKDVKAPYGKGWTKVKKEARYDVVVMGYVEPQQTSIKKGDLEETPTKFYLNGWIGAIKFGQYVSGELIEFGQASGMDDTIRQAVSEDREGYLGHVFEIKAQDRFEKTGKFRHPRFVRWREDKDARECVYDSEEC